MAKAIFELEPIGVDGALEATYSHVFCSDKCREAFKLTDGQQSKFGEDVDFIDGCVCETCGVPLELDALIGMSYTPAL